jgi:CheY-like chemotaxis protein
MSSGGTVGKNRILVVDDNDTNLKLLRWLLEKKGYEVHTAGDARTARETLRSLHPDLVLMDIQLPDVDGLELTRELKADPALRDIPVVAVTSYAMKGDEQKSLDAGCEGYITKPIDTRQFPIEIEKFLKGAK